MLRTENPVSAERAGPAPVMFVTVAGIPLFTGLSLIPAVQRAGLTTPPAVRYFWLSVGCRGGLHVAGLSKERLLHTANSHELI